MNAGLFVYGALLMAMSFTAGAMEQNSAAMISALIATASAALASALAEMRLTFGLPGYLVSNIAAVLSWALAAVAFVVAAIGLA